ncbi:MAG TPA: HAD hydrolase family protein [Membranihabitans sp.]|nr:HAD hydrolase family protein [Membranihabitans sp.]
MENQIFNNIQYLVFDVDGVFTNHMILVTDDGHFLRNMSTRDGYAIQRAAEAGLKMAVITGGTSIGVEKRLRAAGIDIIRSGIHEKGVVFEEILEQEGWPADQVLFMGDDMLDIPCLKLAGVAACPADAIREVLEISDFISPRKGGEDCVRDLVERILSSRGQW